MQFITLATRDYLPYVATLADSLSAYNEYERLVCYLIDDDESIDRHLIRHAEIVPITDLEISNHKTLLFQYDALELVCALKPVVAQHALEHTSNKYVAYLDTDMYVCGSLANIPNLLCLEKSVGLTPHLLSDDYSIDALQIIRTGSNNAGFIILRNNSDARSFLSWWSRCLARECISDVPSGIYYDQRWLDIAAGLFPFVQLLRHPGINTAYWNLSERKVVKKGDHYKVRGDESLLIFHFSGFDRNLLSSNMNIKERVNITETIAELAKEYSEKLERNRLLLSQDTGPYCYGIFDTGEPIKKEMRELVRTNKIKCDNPFRDRDHFLKILKQMPKSEIFSERLEWSYTNSEEVRQRLNSIERSKVVKAIIYFGVRFMRIFRSIVER